jgi:hypothetical protein
MGAIRVADRFSREEIVAIYPTSREPLVNATPLLVSNPKPLAIKMICTLLFYGTVDHVEQSGNGGGQS